jgi:hypothetical protein
MEQVENHEHEAERFCFPDLEVERGEIERVAEVFSREKENFVEEFFRRGMKASLVELDDEMWGNLENTDSTDIKDGDWETVARNSGQKDVARDWEGLRKKIESSLPIDAPIVLYINDRYHLVSGDTRLSVSKALGIRPKVLLVDMNS